LGLAFLGLAGAAPGEGLRATLGLEYDDNLFEKRSGQRAGWISRLYLSSEDRLLERDWGHLSVEHQWGVKRFWRAEAATASTGDVVANHLELGGLLRLGERAYARWGGEVKVKSVQRVSSEESYLRGAYRIGLGRAWAKSGSGELHYQHGGDDGRDGLLADASLHEVGLDLRYGRSRRLNGYAQLNWRWLALARPALVLDGDQRLREGRKDQKDRSFEWQTGVQYFRGALLHASYALLDNRSNSVGYGFRAHRVQVLLTGHLGYGVDGQFYFTAQRRRYDEDLSQPLPGASSEEEEYAQTLVSVKASRSLSERYGLSGQYWYSRNGSRSNEAFYRKNVYSLSLDISL
jgi:hypothetical protein